MTEQPNTQDEPKPKIPAPGTSETFPAYPEGNEHGGIGKIPVPDDADTRGSLIDHPTDGTDSEDRPTPDR
jgi:hypothetical protein